MDVPDFVTPRGKFFTFLEVGGRLERDMREEGPLSGLGKQWAGMQGGESLGLGGE